MASNCASHVPQPVWSLQSCCQASPGSPGCWHLWRLTLWWKQAAYRPSPPDTSHCSQIVSQSESPCILLALVPNAAMAPGSARRDGTVGSRGCGGGSSRLHPPQDWANQAPSGGAGRGPAGHGHAVPGWSLIFVTVTSVQSVTAFICILLAAGQTVPLLLVTGRSVSSFVNCMFVPVAYFSIGSCLMELFICAG